MLLSKHRSRLPGSQSQSKRNVRTQSLAHELRQAAARRAKTLHGDSAGRGSGTGTATNLRLFLDTASSQQMQLWLSTGMFHGLTCNPIILQRDGVKCNIKTLTQLARQGFDLGCKEIHLQAWGSSVAQLSSTAFDLAGIDPAHIVVKLPCTLEGVQTASLLRDSNVRVNITGLFAAPQILVSQAVGADYAAAYLGRMNDAYGGEQGHEQIAEMQKILEGCQSRMRLMVASVRDTSDMTRLAAKGCNTFTISPTIAAKLFNNPYTIDAAGEFELQARNNGGEEDVSKTLLDFQLRNSPSASRSQPEPAAK